METSAGEQSILFSSSFSPRSIISESYRMQRVPVLWYNNQFKSYTGLLTWSKLMLTTTRLQGEVSSECSCISTVSLCPWIVLSSQWIVVLHLMSKQRYIYFFWFSLSLPKCDQVLLSLLSYCLKKNIVVIAKWSFSNYISTFSTDKTYSISFKDLKMLL